MKSREVGNALQSRERVYVILRSCGRCGIYRPVHRREVRHLGRLLPVRRGSDILIVGWRIETLHLRGQEEPRVRRQDGPEVRCRRRKNHE